MSLFNEQGFVNLIGTLWPLIIPAMLAMGVRSGLYIFIYHDKYITFSQNPQLVNLGGASNLHGKLNIAAKHNEVANTNIEAVFDLILNTAVNNGMKQEELPRNILIISDMEFDHCAVDNSYNSRGWGYSGRRMNGTLFDMIKQKYERHGYKLPRLVFWNVNSRTGTIPVKENDMGVALVSGFSPNVAKMVMSGTPPATCCCPSLTMWM